MMIVNKAQAEAWNGKVGAHWADNAERYDAVSDGSNEDLLAAASIGERDRVLDIGCGNGYPTRLAAHRAVHGHVVGVDLSEPMVARARTAAAQDGTTNVTFEAGDAQVFPFRTGEYDVAISRGGVMFFDDHLAAFANIGRALRPGGRLAFVSPQQPDLESDAFRVFAGFNAVLAEHVTATQDPAADPAPRMASLANPERVREVLTGAGFHDVTIKAVDSPVTWGSDAADAAEFILATARVRMNLDGVEESILDNARQRLYDTLLPYESLKGVRLPGAVWVVTATWP